MSRASRIPIERIAPAPEETPIARALGYAQSIEAALAIREHRLIGNATAVEIPLGEAQKLLIQFGKLSATLWNLRRQEIEKARARGGES